MEYIINCIGLLLLCSFGLWKGTNLIVNCIKYIGASHKFMFALLSTTLVGLITTLPESAIAVIASVGGSPIIAVSSLVGTNLFLLVIALGVCALVRPISLNTFTIKRLLPILVLVSISVVCIFIDDIFSYFEGFLLVIVCGLFIIFSIQINLKWYSVCLFKGRRTDISICRGRMLATLLFSSLGFMLIIASSIGLIGVSLDIIHNCNLSDSNLGISLIGFCLAIPELLLAFVALKEEHFDNVLCNIFGSCIFNFTIGLACCALCGGAYSNDTVLWYIAIFLALSIYLWGISLFKGSLTRVPAAVLLSSYAFFILILFI